MSGIDFHFSNLGREQVQETDIVAKLLGRFSLHDLAKSIADMARAPEDSLDHDRGTPSVLLVQGMACRSGVMKTLGEPMKEHVNVAYAPDFHPFGLGDIERAAAKLRTKIDALFATGRVESLTVLGHSLGGPIALEAATGGSRVDRIVTLAAPFSGTRWARFGSFFSAACRAITPDSAYLKQLSQIQLPHAALDVHVAERDMFLRPENQVPRAIVARSLVIHRHKATHHDLIMGPVCDHVRKAVLAGLEASM